MPDERLQERQHLREFIETEAQSLLVSLRLYVMRARLATPHTVDAVAAELLSEVTAEALQHADRLTRPEGTKTWLLSIAANLIKRRYTRLGRLAEREPLIRDLNYRHEASMSDDELFDYFSTLKSASPEDVLDRSERVGAILAHVSEDDAEILRLAIIHELDGDTLANELGITRGAAYVRLHRALGRLRKQFNRIENND
ncbi:MAG: sigma-70 family RNA polymerase sigma factor [Chloroflexi bacterium]|nr:MAG: sigma-70 family RNA polymerase sigma factor [Chloroflexota bacterium]